LKGESTVHFLTTTRNSQQRRALPGRTILALVPALLLFLTVIAAGCGSDTSADNAPTTDTGSKPVTIQKGNVNQMM
jgi:hypothetical protein